MDAPSLTFLEDRPLEAAFAPDGGRPPPHHRRVRPLFAAPPDPLVAPGSAGRRPGSWWWARGRWAMRSSRTWRWSAWGRWYVDRPRRHRAVSNLSRSVLFRAEDGGRPKAEVAARADGKEINPEVALRCHPGRRDHRPRPRPVRRRRRGDRLPRQPRGPALGQPPVLEGRHALGRLGHPGDPGGRQGFRPARLILLRMHDDGPRLSTPQRPL